MGGTVVYSTCSLSPIQNDGIVKMALKKIWEETNHQIVIKYACSIKYHSNCVSLIYHLFSRDLTQQFKPLRSLYSFGSGLKYGQLVMPFLPLNYGPLYLCKLVRTK